MIYVFLSPLLEVLKMPRRQTIHRGFGTITISEGKNHRSTKRTLLLTGFFERRQCFDDVDHH